MPLLLSFPVEGVFAVQGKQNGCRYDDTAHPVGWCSDLDDYIAIYREQKTCREKGARGKGSDPANRTGQTASRQKVKGTGVPYPDKEKVVLS